MMKTNLLNIQYPKGSARRLAVLWGALCCLVCTAGAEAPLNFFEGENDDRIVVSFADNSEALLFRVAHEHRTLAAGTARMEGDGLVRLQMTLPEVNAGVALPVTLTFSRHGGTLLETRTAYVFSKVPAVNPKRKIYLVDDVGGRTAEHLDALSVAFETVRNAEAIAELKQAFIIVGSALDDDTAWKAVLNAAEHGADVLRLASLEERTIVLPRILQNFSMGRTQDILRDANAPYQLAILEGGLRLAAQGGDVALRMGDDAPAPAQAAQWTYDGGGRVRVCGTPLTVAWERTPVARWLLAEMITTGEKP